MRIAVVIVGQQNSGKTATLKEIGRKHANKNPQRTMAGWRILSLFPDSFHALALHAYFVPASPTETNFKLEDRFKDWKPEVLFVAEQINGENFISTFDFLKKEDYKILRFDLTNQIGFGIWDRFDHDSAKSKLDARVDLIMNDVKNQIGINYFGSK
jgi:hypothetical protein